MLGIDNHGTTPVRNVNTNTNTNHSSSSSSSSNDWNQHGISHSTYNSYQGGSKGSSSSGSSGGGGKCSGGQYYSWENTITLAILFGLSGVYLYLLLSPDQPAPLGKPKPYVIPADTKERFNEFLKSYHASNDYEGGRYDFDKLQESFNGALTSETIEKEWGSRGSKDDFFYEGREEEGGGGTTEEQLQKDEPNIPSKNYRCEKGWLTIRSDTNYKYLWMHSGTDYWMSATATMDTPLHRRAFYVETVDSNGCNNEGEGWVILKEGDTQGM